MTGTLDRNAFISGEIADHSNFSRHKIVLRTWINIVFVWNMFDISNFCWNELRFNHFPVKWYLPFVIPHRWSISRLLLIMVQKMQTVFLKQYFVPEMKLSWSQFVNPNIDVCPFWFACEPSLWTNYPFHLRLLSLPPAQWISFVPTKVYVHTRHVYTSLRLVLLLAPSISCRASRGLRRLLFLLSVILKWYLCQTLFSE